MDKTLAHFRTLVEIVERLRGPKGCPWDQEQTQRSLTQYAIEEAYELVEAIESGDQSHVREELGDYLFQVVLQAQVARDEGFFELAQVLENLNEKLVRRHPHVFGDVKAGDSEAVWRNWHAQKLAEKREIFSYPRTMPALQAADKIGVKSAGFKFDWSSANDVFTKVREEVDEVGNALLGSDSAANAEAKQEALSHEIGDLLFSIAQLARHLDLDAEACLREANRRFERRFSFVLQAAGIPPSEFASLPDAEKERLWSLAKTAEKNGELV